MPTQDLFESIDSRLPPVERIGDEAVLLRGFALPFASDIVPLLAALETQAPFRQMTTPGGFTMSVSIMNCGTLGWISDRRGYRYAHEDPLSGKPWPAMPKPFSTLAQEAAAAAGFFDFTPDACLINRYLPGTKMSLHQDKDERNLQAPIVSVSLGIPAVFQFGGHARSDKTVRVPVFHGDVVVWGGADRLRFHGVLPLKDAVHAVLGPQRINLTFREAA